MTLFPAFLRLRDRPVVVVGGGAIASSKIPGLLEAGARITIIAPQLNAQLAERVRSREIEWLPRAFEPTDLDGKFLVVAATSLRDVNATVFAEAERCQILCNAVDDIDHCHFYYGAIVQRGDLQIAISTNGKSPALAQRYRQELEQHFSPEYAVWLDHLGKIREQLRIESTDPESIKNQLHQLASRESFQNFVGELKGRNGGSADSSAPVSQGEPASPAASPSSSTVYLIGAGPGDPDLLTRKAARLLQSADIVLHDSLVSPEILALIPTRAERIDVGKRARFRLLTQSDINALLVDAGSKHKIVVRLKGGDPLLFGRAAEEIEALRAANIPFEIVPGVSAAFASAAAAQISLTDRRLASRVLFTTFSRSEDTRSFSSVPVASDTTVVVYMPGPDYAEVSRWLINSGIVAETPCLVISKASQREQVVRYTTVSLLASLPSIPSPALLIVGRVASQSVVSAVAADWLKQFVPENMDNFSIS